MHAANLHSWNVDRPYSTRASEHLPAPGAAWLRFRLADR
ncbi:hypothetical protein GPN2_10040 [Streptomyces murinus]